MTKKTKNILLLSAAIIILFLIIYWLSDVFIVFVLSVLLSFLFHPLVNFIEKRGLSRFLSTLIVFIVVATIFYFGLNNFIPLFTDQLDALINAAKDFHLQKQIATIDVEVRKVFPIFNRGELSKRIEDFFSTELLNSFGVLSGLLTSIISLVAVLVIVPFITFFALKDSRKILHNLLDMVPNKYFEPSYWIIKKVSIQLGRFVRAWIFDATFVGFTLGFGFYLIGIPNSLPLGVIAGFGHLIPYFGPVIGGIPAIAISIIQNGDFSQVPLIIAIILTVYALDNGVVQPMVFSKSVDLHPIIIILLIIAGSQIAGILGMLLAVPTVTVLKTFIKEVYFAWKNYRIVRT
ncbi:MAG TPA: AI-2E family transporter [Ignavibacteriaceae bacterium]|nr:AI-2E family transporter [Ignavibacteriaceae bacterium]